MQARMTGHKTAIWRSPWTPIIACFLALVPLSFLLGLGYLTLFDSAVFVIEPSTFFQSVAWILLASLVVTFFVLPLYGLPAYVILKRIGLGDRWWAMAFSGTLPGLLLLLVVDQRHAEIADVAIIYGAILGLVFCLAASRSNEKLLTIYAGQPRMRQDLGKVLFNSFVVLVISVVATFATLAVKTRVESESESAAIALGWPVPFLVQDRSVLDPPSWPRYYRFGAPQEFPTKIRVLSLVVDTAFFFVAIGSLVPVANVARSYWQS